jgi:predicted transcriptional regulator of viral defense system
MQYSDMKTCRAKPNTTLKAHIVQRIEQATSNAVWTPTDFLDLAPRDRIDKTLQRMVSNGELRRIDRGFYDQPTMNALTHRSTSADYQSVIQAISRQNQIRILIDGMAAANSLGLTHAVPGQITVHTDIRIQPIQLGNLTIQFKLTAPSKLYWAGDTQPCTSYRRYIGCMTL